MSPPAPMPWMARKAMSSTMVWERPDSMDPARKITMASWKRLFRP